jgi:hypothetical protein
MVAGISVAFGDTTVICHANGCVPGVEPYVGVWESLFMDRIHYINKGKLDTLLR